MPFLTFERRDQPGRAAGGAMFYISLRPLLPIARDIAFVFNGGVPPPGDVLCRKGNSARSLNKARSLKVLSAKRCGLVDSIIRL
jgi:hypothetical protein